jgi:Trk K+ transport system NAD-binding subunit
MKVCIAGGGRVGRYLAQSLLANRHEIVIIEPVESQCRMLADTLDIPVICGDSISVDTLRTADVASCDAFVAVTGSDEDNLVACQIAKREFGVDRTVARASNPSIAYFPPQINRKAVGDSRDKIFGFLVRRESEYGILKPYDDKDHKSPCDP